MTAKKVLGFDMDGTLIDSIYVHLNAFMYASKKLRLGLKKKQILPLFSYIGEIILKKLVPSISHDLIEEFAQLEKEHFVKHVNEVKPFPDVAQTLTCLKEKYSIILISNTDYKLVLKSLEAAGLNPFFFDLIVSDDLVQHPKPFPDELLIAKKILHHKLDYYIGDSIVDMKAGKNAKVKTIGVTTGVNSEEQLRKYKPYAIINKLAELPTILK